MAIITLTTDFGEKDYFAGATKGAIYSELPDVKIVDISHTVSPFNIPEAAYIIQNAYNSFPKGTIHIIGIDSEINPENKHIGIKLDDHYFICANNGIMSMICAEIAPEKIVEINIHDRIESSFPVLDVFVQVACFISRGGNLTVIGKETSTYKEMTEIQPKVSQDQKMITGGVIYIDNYGNIISNINKTFDIKQPRNIKKINLNIATQEDLVQVPYIDYELAYSIIEMRVLKEGFKTVDELTKLKDFPTNKLDIIKLYLHIK